MAENQFATASHAIAHAAIDLAETHEVPPTSTVFALLCAYLDQPGETLKAEVEAVLAQPLNTRLLALDEVYDRLLGKGATGDGLERIRSGLAVELRDVAVSLSNGVDGNLKLAGELRQSLRDLAGMVTREELQMLCRHLVYSGREQLNDTQNLAARLEKTQYQLSEMQQELSDLREKSTRDHLTGLQNRRHFDERLLDLVRTRTPFCLALLSLDDMKGLNDTWGHQVGDNVLRGVGKLLRANLKGKDLVARIGGEEFALIMPETPLAGAQALCENIRATFHQITWISQSTEEKIGHCTLSVGVSQSAESDTGQTIYARADSYLYQAKAGGRNQVIAGV